MKYTLLALAWGAPIYKETARLTYSGSRSSDVVYTVGEYGEGTKHGQELGESGRRFDLVNVGSPHGLDIIVLGDLDRSRGMSVSKAGKEREEEIDYRFTEIDSFLGIPPTSRVSQLPRISG